MSANGTKSFQGLKISENASFTRGGMATIDFDGSPTAYAPTGSGLPTQDFLGNAGHPGNWWALVTDNGKKDGNPIINTQTGYYVSTTAWGNTRKDGSREYVNSDIIPYVAITQEDREKRNIKYGDFVLLTNDQTGVQTWAIAADYAGGKIERNRHSEVSAAAARALGIDFVKRGIRGPSLDQRGETTISMQFFPGSKIQGFFPHDEESAYKISLGPEVYKNQTLLAINASTERMKGNVIATNASGVNTLAAQANQTFQPQINITETSNRQKDLQLTTARINNPAPYNSPSSPTLPATEQPASNMSSLLSYGMINEGDTGNMMGIMLAVFVLQKLFGNEALSPRQEEFANATGNNNPSISTMISENSLDADIDEETQYTQNMPTSLQSNGPKV